MQSSLEQLYDNLNDHLAATINYPGWRKGVYPTRQDAVADIKENALFVAIENEEVVGSMILCHEPEPAYYSAPWSVNLADHEVNLVET